MNQTKISVIMPSLNVSKYIKQCLQSVLNQTLEDIEIICVDGGSTDGTLDIIQQYVKKDNRVKLIHSDIKSYGYQMNLGIKEASGDYIGIVETDDYIQSDMYRGMSESSRIAESMPQDVKAVRKNCAWYRESLCN